jgi:hypothetical protein
MLNNKEDLKYENVINILNKLQKVKVPENFEADLMRKINSIPQSGIEKKPQDFWDKIFKGWISTRLIPSAGLAAAAVIVLFMINTNSNEAENLLLSEPRIREDIITAGSQDIQVNVEDALTKDAKKDELKNDIKEKSKTEMNKEEITPDSDLLDLSAGRNNIARVDIEKRIGHFRTEISSNVSYVINKSGLNFRMVNLTKEQRNELKEKIKSLIERYNNSRHR